MKHRSVNSQIRIPPCRSGVMLVEMVIALILLSAVASILPVVLRGVAQQRHLERFDRLTLVELGNAVERLRTHSSSSDPLSIELSDWFRQRYPAAMLEVQQMASEEGKDGGEQPWRVTVRQSIGGNQPDQVQSIVTWINSGEASE